MQTPFSFMRQLNLRQILLCALAFMGAAAASAQTIEIAGSVRDAAVGDPLPHAVVTIHPLKQSVRVDEQGRFTFNVPPGEYELSAFAEGYETSGRFSIDATGGAPASPAVIGLNPRVYAIGEIAVLSRPLPKMSSETGRIAQRQQSVGFTDGVSSEWMSVLGASDAGSALKAVAGTSLVGGKYVYVRGLGERYSSTLVNGIQIPSPEPNRRVIPMDLFPASLLENIDVVKTFTPDLPGDFSGGSAMVVTKDFPDAFVFSVSASLSSNTATTGEDALTYDGGGLDFLGFDDGTRDIPDQILSEAGGAAIRKRGRFTPLGFEDDDIQAFGRAFHNVWSPETVRAPVNQSYKMTLGNSTQMFGKPFGYIGVLTYGNDWSTRETERNTFRLTRNDAGETELTPTTDYDTAQSTNNAALSAALNASLRLSKNARFSVKTLYTRSTDKEARSWQGYNADRSTDLRSGRILFIERQLISSQLSGEHRFAGLRDSEFVWRAGLSQAARDEPDSRETLYEFRGGDYYFRDITQSGSRFFFDLTDNEAAGRVDWTTPISSAGGSKVKIGAYARDRSRVFDARRFRFEPFSNIEEAVDLSAPPEELFAEENIAPGLFELRESTRATDNYEATQRSLAGYLQAELTAGALQTLIGARLESSDQVVTTFDPFSTDAVPIVADLKAVDLLPSLNLRYSFSNRFKMRAAASRTLTRPDLREMAPFEYTDFVGGSKELGNPDLGRTLIQNYDIGFEYFPREGELMALNGFYKLFNDPIEEIIQPSAEVITTYANALGANHFGVEMEWRQRLDKIAKPLSPFLLNANLTLIKSQVELPDIGIQTSSDRALQGQSPYLLNIALVYDNPDINLSGTMNIHSFGRRIASVGNHGLPDVYEDGRTEMSLSIDKQLTPSVQISLSGKNLLNPETLLTQGGETYARSRAGRSFSVSVKYNL